MTTTIYTWNKKPLEIDDILLDVVNGDEYHTMIYGWMLALGNGVEQDVKKGDNLLQSMFDSMYGQETKFLYAQSLHLQGQESKSNIKKTTFKCQELEVLEELAEDNFSPALFQLGLNYQYVYLDARAPDLAKAEMYYKRAAKLGNVHARKKLWSLWFENMGLKGRAFRALGTAIAFPHGCYVLLKYGLHDERMHF